MTKARFQTLDGMRGLAAVAVMLYHIFPSSPSKPLYHSYLAVDLFFLLSGFVIAFTYEHKLTGPMSLGSFALTRAIRLYPLAIASVISVALLRLSYPKFTIPTGDFLFELLTNVLLIPNSLMSNREHFTFVAPSWSLFYELTVNLFYGIVLTYLVRKKLVVFTICMGLTLGILAYLHGSVMLLHENIAMGFPRALFSFYIGVMIFRGNHGNVKTIKIPVVIQYIILASILCLPSMGNWNWLYDMLTISLVFPVIISAAIQNQSNQFGIIEKEMGEISYPLYILHMPVLAYTGVALGWTASNQTIAIMAALLSLLVSSLAWRLFDRPLRVWLSKLVHRPIGPYTLRAEP